MTDAPIARFLRETREAQRRATDGEPWSQDDFLEALERATGWHLHRPNYSRYETGKSIPSPATLRRLVGFWESRGIVIPDFNAAPQAPDQRDPMARLADAIELLTGELAAAREERAAMADRVADLEALVRGLVEPALGGGPTPHAPRSKAGSAG